MKSLCSILLILAGLTIPAEVSAKSPNVVMLISDDQAWTDYGFMEHPVIRTPNLDKLAKQSALFPRGYVPTSLCRPSLATMITGQYPHRHGITGNDPPRGVNRAEMLKHIQAAETVPERLGKAGYLSHQSGKWWEGSPELGGFTHFMSHGDPSRGGRHGDEGLKIGRQGMQPVFDFIDMSQQEGKPFFLWYAPFLPHQPHNPPVELLKKYQAPDRPMELARYYAMCEWFDQTCGELLDYLEDKQLAENTLVLYVCDNGWIQKTPQSELPEGWKHPFAPRSKRSPNEGGTRTPILVRWPGHVKPGTYSTLVSSIDLAPTIYAATGAEPETELPGINLLKVIENGGRTERDTLYGELFEHDVTDIDDPEKSLLYRWVIEGDWKLILPHHAEGKPELYNLQSDPHEEHDLAVEHPEKVQALTKKLEAWWSVKPPAAE